MRALIPVFFVYVGCVAPLLYAGQGSTTSVIRDVRPVVFPKYNTYPGITRYAPTPAEYTRVVGDRAFAMERVTYRSDDLAVYAYLYRPAIPPRPTSGRHGHALSKTRSANAGGRCRRERPWVLRTRMAMTDASIADARGKKRGGPKGPPLRSI